MSNVHPTTEAIGSVTHWYGHLSVAGVKLSAPLAVGDRIHVKGHTTDLVETIRSMEIDHHKVDRARPGDDVAVEVDGHVHEHDLIFFEE